MLEYENQLFLETIEQNELYIFAKGILTQKVLSNILKLYSSQESLVYILGASQPEETFFLGQLSPSEKCSSITNEVNANERKGLYNGGGLFFITPRIFIVDLLKKVAPVEKITGIIILRAHNVIESSQEAFILRLYRSSNKTGFIKAFSNSPTAFLLGFSRVSRVMRSTFLAHLSLWPRFHSSVKECLAKNMESSSVVEIQLNLTPEMREIQTNLLDLVGWAVGELKRLVPALNDEEISVENALTKGFHKIIDGLMDPNWNIIVPKSKDVLNELKLFRQLLALLTKVDCVSFHSFLSNYTTRESALKSNWVFSDSGEKIINASRARFLVKEGGKETSGEKTKSSIKFQPEVHPKWLALGEILNEICIKQEKSDEEDQEISQDSDADLFADLEGTPTPKKNRIENPMRPSKLKTLILAEDVKTCANLRDYLSLGSELTLAKIASNVENIQISLPSATMEKIKRSELEKKRERRRDSEKRRDLIGQNDDDEKEEEAKKRERQITLTQINRKYEEIQFLESPIFIRPIKSFKQVEAFGIPQALEQLLPDIVILFDPTLEVVRDLEVHIARFGGVQTIRVYFLVFHNSIEEQIYLTSIQREKNAFEALIAQKANLLVPKEREGRDELNEDLWRDPTKASETVSTSKASKRDMSDQDGDKEREIILTDMREFRSDLPSLIHKRGIDLEPITLDVGDYVLTPEICVERKSISDLVGSLGSGRLYKQAEAMSRHYKKPILLIEHEQQAQSGINAHKYKNDLAQIMPKLQILTLHFPKLKLIWSPGAHYTSEIFHELKRGKPQPIAEQALSIQKNEVGDYSESRFNPSSHAFLSKMPGIDSRNVYSLLNRCSNLDDLAKLSIEELNCIVMSEKVGGVLHSGLHSNLTKGEEGDSSGRGAGPSSKSRSNRGRR